MRKMMKRALSMLLAMVLCIGCVTMLATTVLAADADSLDDHLVLYSSFDDSNANDESGNGHHGTAVGNVQYADGVSGKGVHLTSTYVDYGNSSAIIPDTGDFSFSVFFRSAGTTSDSSLLGNKNYKSGNNTGFVFLVRDDWAGNQQRLNVGLGGSGSRMYCGDSGIINDLWHHLVCTFDRDGLMTYYVDGVKVKAEDISAKKDVAMNAGLSLQLGADGCGQYRLGDGYVDELCIYNKALTADEVEQLCESTAPASILARAKLTTMLNALQAVIPSPLYPQESIDEMITMVNSALNQLGIADEAQCLALLTNCQAAYKRFLDGAAPLASFHWVSDVHVPYYNDGYATALQNMASINAASNIGLIITGDITNGGSAAQFETFYQLTKENSPVSAANTAIILGNHDVRKSNSPSTPDQYDPSTSNWATAKGLYLQHNAEYMPSTDTVYHVKEIGGYTFIMLNTEMDLRDASYMSREQLAWLEETLAAAYEKDPNKPIFIVHHQPLYDTHYDSNRQRTFLMEGMTEEESNNKIKEVLAKYPTTIFMSGHLHNGFSTIRGIVRPFGAAVEIPAFDDGGNSYEVQIYSDCVVFRAINYVTGEYAPAYDMTIQIGENNVSAIYQEAQKVLAESSKYDATAIANIQTLSNTLYGLITVSYTSVGSLDNFYKAAQHTEINATAQRLKSALNDLRGNVSAGDTVTVVAGEALQLAADGATGWSSGNESIFTVDASGKLTALKSGTATLTVTTAGGEFTCNVTVKVNTSALDDAIYAANTLKTNVAVADTVCGAGVGKVYVSTAAMQALNEALALAQAALADATTEAEVASAAKAMNDALDAFRAVIKVAVAHEGELACSVKCKYGCGTVVAHVACVGEIACQDNACKYCGKVVTPLAHKGEFECSNICQYGCGTAVEPKAHEIEEDGVMCKYGCGKLMGDPTASLVDADGVTTYYTSLEEAVTAATSGATVNLLADINLGSLDANYISGFANNLTIDGMKEDGTRAVITATTESTEKQYIFNVDSGQTGFTLKNMICNITGKGAENAVIRTGGTANASVENCEFNMSGTGLGIFAYYHKGSLTVENTSITSANMCYKSHQHSPSISFVDCTLESTNDIAMEMRTGTKLTLTNTTVKCPQDKSHTIWIKVALTVTISGNTSLTGAPCAIHADDAITLNFTDFTSAQIIRKNGSDYHFYDTLTAALDAGATVDQLFTYSAETAEAIKAEGYFVIANGTRYTIGEPGATLTVDGTTTPYATLKDAIDAANLGNGGTITMLADYDYGTTGLVSFTKNITIDGQGQYKITAKITTDFYRPAAGVTLTLQNLTMTAEKAAGDNIAIIYIPDVAGAIVSINNCTITSTNDIALASYKNKYGAYNINNSTIIGHTYAIRYNNSDHAINISNNSKIYGGTYAILMEGTDPCANITITDSTVTAGIYLNTGHAKVTLAGNTVVDSKLIATLYPDAGYTGSDYAVQISTANNALTVIGNAKINGSVNHAAGAFNLGTTDAAFTGAQVIRKNGNIYHFYDFSSSLEFQEGDFTYSEATADALVAQYYTVSEASGIYTVTGKIDVAPLENAISAAENAKANVVSAEKACMAGAGNRYVTPAQMDALNAAIATAKAKLAAIRSADQVTAAVNELNPVVAAFEDAIETGIAHDGEYDCSTTCKYDCGTAITAKSAHVGEKDCSTTCKWCNTTITAKSAHVGEHDCSTTCKWCNTTITAKSAHVGEHDCSTTCKWCDTAITAKSAHVGEHDCSTTCKYGCGTTVTGVAHEGEFDCSTTCKYGCGTAITPKKAHDGEYDCSTTCKYGCGTAITDAKTCVGTVPCVDTSCKWCGEAVTPIAHDMVTDAAKAPTCTETGLTEGSHCSRCDTATTAQQVVAATGHKYDNDSDASCNVCGAERAVENQTNGNENTANGSENNAQNGNIEAPAKQGLSGGAVAGIVIGVVAVLGGGGFALFWFVIRKKKV